VSSSYYTVIYFLKKILWIIVKFCSYYYHDMKL
jgi:hypothetical protein